MSHLAIADLSASIDGELMGTALEETVAHLSSCHDCRERGARLARNDEVLRSLLGYDLNDDVLNELSRRSEAIVVAIVRGLPAPPIVASTPRADGPNERAVEPPAKAQEPVTEAGAKPRREPASDAGMGLVERFTRFEPPAKSAPAAGKQDATATPANAAESLPPPRDPSRAMRRPEPRGAGGLDVTPRFDMDRAPDARGDAKHDRLVESYDSFHDQTNRGPIGRQLPPTLARPQDKKEGDAEPPKREYRHGGVRRDPSDAASRPSDTSPRGAQRPAPREDGFGVRRNEGAAWTRLGLEPDPSRPGMYRESLTGASVAPPPVGSRGAARTSTSRSSRTGPIMALLIVGGLVAVYFAMRMPGANNLALRFGSAKPAPSAGSTPGLDVHAATARPAVDVAVPQGASGQAVTPDAPNVCGRVLDTKDRPVPGVLFTVASTTAQVRSDAQGHFCLSAPLGMQVVDVLDPRGSGTHSIRIRLDFVAGAPDARIVLP